MNIRGKAFLSKKALITQKHGPAVWDAFLAEETARDPYFNTPILPITPMPAENFLPFLDRLLARFFEGDPKFYWAIGEKSAEWSFREGPSRSLFYSGDYHRFLVDCPVLWRSYFTAGRAQVRAGEAEAEVEITEVPVHHLYFEYSVLGHVKRGLELTGSKPVTHERVRGFSNGDGDLLYRFRYG